MFSDADVSEQDSTTPFYSGVFRQGKVELDYPVSWPEGLRVRVQLAEPTDMPEPLGHVVIAGFGLVGRCAADVLDKYAIDYVVIETNERTVSGQRTLGRQAILGDVSNPEVLEAARIRSAGMLVLTIPDQEATISAVRAAKAASPSLFVVARAVHTSGGLQTRQVGADVVINAERVVAKEFYEWLLLRLMAQGSGKSAAR